MPVQVNELELCRGGKHTGTNFAVTIQCKVFATFGPTTEMTVSLPETRHHRIRPSSIEMPLRTCWVLPPTPLRQRALIALPLVLLLLLLLPNLLPTGHSRAYNSREGVGDLVHSPLRSPLGRAPIFRIPHQHMLKAILLGPERVPISRGPERNLHTPRLSTLLPTLHVQHDHEDHRPLRTAPCFSGHGVALQFLHWRKRSRLWKNRRLGYLWSRDRAALPNRKDHLTIRTHNLTISLVTTSRAHLGETLNQGGLASRRRFLTSI